MPTVRFEGNTYEAAPNETVLDTLLRSGIAAPHSCKAGACGTCRMRAVFGNVSVGAQSGLRTTEVSEGIFHPCQQKVTGDFVVERDKSTPTFETKIVHKFMASHDVVIARLAAPEGFEFRAGQFIRVNHLAPASRCYSIASLPHTSSLELHIRLLKLGVMSYWWANEAEIGSKVSFEGPFGSCSYDLPQNQPMLLIGSGTGLAPLLGVVRDAMDSGHIAPIRIYLGGADFESHYLTDDLLEMAAANPQFKFVPCTDRPVPDQRFRAGSPCQAALNDNPKLAGWAVYTCGHPLLVQDTKKRAFLAGAKIQDIFSDPFVDQSVQRAA